jgi:hypothetical protein
MDLDMLEWRAMNAIAKTSTFVLLLAAALPVVVVTSTGCDKFKKGDADAAVEAGPVATTVDTTAPTDTATPSATTTVVTPVWHPSAKVDGGVKMLDAGPPIKLADGGVVAPIPTPVPNGTLTPPPGFPTALPSNLVIPTALPSGLPKGLPTAIPTTTAH